MTPDEIIQNELGFNPFAEHQPEPGAYNNEMLTELRRGLRTRRNFRDYQVNPHDDHDFRRKNAIVKAKANSKGALPNVTRLQQAIAFKKDAASLEMHLNFKNHGIKFIKYKADDFNNISDYLQNLEPTRRFEGDSNELFQKDKFLQSLDNLFFDSRSTVDKYLRSKEALRDAPYDRKMWFYNNIFWFHNYSWMSLTRRAKQMMLTAMHSWIYRTRFNFIYVQRIRWRMMDTFRYRLGFCFALLRIITEEMREIYGLMKSFYNNPFTPMWHHASHYMIRVYDKLHRLSLDAKDVISYIKLLEAYRKLEETPDFYDHFLSSQLPLWGAEGVFTRVPTD